MVTSLSADEWPVRELYEELYCARGEMENRIKEQLSLFADRMSAQTLRANQLRLYFSGLAYTLILGLRRLGLEVTRWARAQTETIRRRLLKIGVRVKVTARPVWLSLAEEVPRLDVAVERGRDPLLTRMGALHTLLKKRQRLLDNGGLTSPALQPEAGC